MTFAEYQAHALTTAGNVENEFMHRVLGLVGEAGEIAEKVKKLIRDQQSDISLLDKEDMAKELGDVLWYIATLADYLDIPLETIAQMNVDKLAKRKQSGKIGGSGDNR